MEHVNWTPGRKERGVCICSPCYRARAKGYAEAQKAADPELFKERKSRWRKENREEYNRIHIEPNRKWRANNKEKLLASVKAWQERNPEKVEEYRKRSAERAKQKRLENPKPRRKR